MAEVTPPQSIDVWVCPKCGYVTMPLPKESPNPPLCTCTDAHGRASYTTKIRARYVRADLPGDPLPETAAASTKEQRWDAVARIERRATSAIAEMREEMALTDATRSRSTSRRKSAAQRAADRARVDAYCEAVRILTGEPTPFAVELRLGEAGCD